MIRQMKRKISSTNSRAIQVRARAHQIKSRGLRVKVLDRARAHQVMSRGRQSGSERQGTRAHHQIKSQGLQFRVKDKIRAHHQDKSRGLQQVSEHQEVQAQQRAHQAHRRER